MFNKKMLLILQLPTSGAGVVDSAGRDGVKEFNTNIFLFSFGQVTGGGKVSL